MNTKPYSNTTSMLRQAKSLYQQGRFEEAEAAGRQVLDDDSHQPDALHLLGLLFHRTGRTTESLMLIEQAIALNPAVAGFHNSLGVVLKSLERPADAEAALRCAVSLNANLIQAWANLGDLLIGADRFSEAEEALGRMKPQTAKGILLSHLRRRLRSTGLDEYDNVLRIAIELFPQDVDIQAARLFRLNFDESLTPEELSGQYRIWSRNHFPECDRLRTAPGTGIVNNPGTPARSRRIPIAYVGTYLHVMFLEKILKHHDPDRFELFLLTDDNRINPAALGGRVTVAPFSQIDPVRYCRERQVRIAVDLVGPFPFLNGMRQFAAFQQRLAPIQCGWIATTGTTGSTAIDYLLADPFLIEPAEEDLYVERIAPLPEVCHCWTHPAAAPLPGTLPARRNGYVTFGSANRGFKLNDPQLSLWAALLQRCPGSRFRFKGQHCSDARFVSRTQALFREFGVEPRRLDFEPFSRHPEFLEFYQGIDISLDTFPYNGGITTLESLWMGVPVVSRAGRRFVSRVTGSYLRCLRRAEWTTTSDDEYIEAACSLAGDIARLESERATLRERLAQCVLCDGPRFTGQLENLYERLLAESGPQGTFEETGNVAPERIRIGA